MNHVADNDEEDGTSRNKGRNEADKRCDIKRELREVHYAVNGILEQAPEVPACFSGNAFMIFIFKIFGIETDPAEDAF